LLIGQLALGPLVEVSQKVSHACGDGGPTPIGLFLLLHGESQWVSHNVQVNIPANYFGPTAKFKKLSFVNERVLSQDFHFGFLILSKRTAKLVARGFLLTNFNSGQPGVRVEHHPCRPGKPKPGNCPCSSDFSAHLSVPPPFFAKILICQPPNSTPPVLAAHRSAAPCF
jgi:hypothetical protein